MVRERSQSAASSGSCVTIIIVCPCRLRRSKKSWWISALVAESRLPEGSSAKRMAGSFTRARAMATRCCSPPDSSEGLWLVRPSRPTSVSNCKSRNHDILQGGEFREQVMKLENEANPAVAEVGQRRTAQGGSRVPENRLPVQHQRSGIGRGKRAQDLQEGRFSGARGTHDGDDFPFLGGKIDSFEDLQRSEGFANGVGFDDHNVQRYEFFLKKIADALHSASAKHTLLY